MKRKYIALIIPVVLMHINLNAQANTNFAGCASGDCEVHVEPVEGTVVRFWCTGTTWEKASDPKENLPVGSSCFMAGEMTGNGFIGGEYETSEEFRHPSTYGVTYNDQYKGTKTEFDASNIDPQDDHICVFLHVNGAPSNFPSDSGIYEVSKCIDVPKIRCAVGDIKIDYGDISISDFDGKEKEENGSVTCLGDATVKLEIVDQSINLTNGGTAEITFPDSGESNIEFFSPGNVSTNFKIKSKLSGKVSPGPFNGSTTLIISIQ